MQAFFGLKATVRTEGLERNLAELEQSVPKGILRLRAPKAMTHSPRSSQATSPSSVLGSEALLGKQRVE